MRRHVLNSLSSDFWVAPGLTGAGREQKSEIKIELTKGSSIKQHLGRAIVFTSEVISSGSMKYYVAYHQIHSVWNFAPYMKIVRPKIWPLKKFAGQQM